MPDVEVPAAHIGVHVRVWKAAPGEGPRILTRQEPKLPAHAAAASESVPRHRLAHGSDHDIDLRQSDELDFVTPLAQSDRNLRLSAAWRTPRKTGFVGLRLGLLGRRANA